MEVRNDSPHMKTGRFLWMDTNSKKLYLEALNKKIVEGYFFSEQILSKIVDDMAPVFNDHIETDSPAQM
jgi:hypothetical protein